MALPSDLTSTAVLGIDAVLCLTRDHITIDDHKDAKPVHDLDSFQLLPATLNKTMGLAQLPPSEGL